MSHDSPVGTLPRGASLPMPSATEKVDWRAAMKRAIRSQSELRRRLGLVEDPAANEAESFPTFVPLEMLSRINPRDERDPILRQVLATSDELIHQADERLDPVGDLASHVGGGLIKKYDGRALLVTSGACAVHCRYCFRREFPYSENTSAAERYDEAIVQVEQDATIEEVILSGGDPLTLTDGALDRLLSRIESIDHVRRLRVHSRLPVAIPQRITPELTERLAASRLAVWFVVHINHAQEVDDAVASSLKRLRQSGTPVLNQSVLLAGVNDDVDVLAELSLRLIDLGVQPYYLHRLDRVHGSGHFWVDEQRGREIVDALRERLPGYAVPKFVVEQAGAKSKTPIA